MATLQKRSDSYRVLFVYNGKRESFTLGQVSAVEAEAKAAQVGYLLLRLKQRLAALPPGVSIADYCQFDGNPPPPPVAGVAAPIRLTLGQLRDKYIATHEASLEPSTVRGIRTHFKHLVAFLGEKFPVADLALGDLQRYVDKRSKAKGVNGRKLSAATLIKELVSLRTAWNWGVKMKFVAGKFPNDGVRLPKSIEKPAFATRAEIERTIEAGGLTKAEESDFWDALYLTVEEIADLLKQVKGTRAQPFVYPLLCFIAHTGARRSEVIRLRTSDVDFTAKVATITEMKRVRGKVSRRKVPMSSFLMTVLKEWLAAHPGGPWLFCQRAVVERSKKRGLTTGHTSKDRPTTVSGRQARVTAKSRAAVSPITRDEVYDHFRRALKGTRWDVIRGLHCLRHSFVSACASRGVDQRLVEAWAGHMSIEMSRRYAHLWPSVQQDALAQVFGV